MGRVDTKVPVPSSEQARRDPAAVLRTPTRTQSRAVVGNRTRDLLSREQAPAQDGLLVRRALLGSTIRRQLRTGGDFTAATSPGKPALAAMARLMDEYNVLAPPTAKTAGEFNACFAKLRELDAAIYAWFSAASVTHSDLTSDPDSAQVRVLMNEAATEAEELIRVTKNDVTVLPMSTTGLGGPEITALGVLWQDIVNGRGKLKVVGPPAFQSRVLGELVRILGTPTGRQLLGYLNAPPVMKMGEVPPAPEMTDIYIGEALANLPREVQEAAPHLEEKAHSEAQPLAIPDDISATRAPLDGTETEVDFPTMRDVTELQKHRDAVFSGAKGFRFGGIKYVFKGTTAGKGAFVTSQPGLARPGAADDHEIVHPGFVTLAHELGHAANMRAGAAMIGEKAQTTGEMAGIPEAEAQFRWQNAEELLNISNVENAVRQESGLTARGSHVGFDAALKNKRKKELQQIFKRDFLESDGAWINVPEIKNTWAEIGRTWVRELADDARFEFYKGELRNLTRAHPTGEVVKLKRERVVAAVQVMEKAWKKAGRSKKKLHAVEHDTLLHKGTSGIEGLVHYGSDFDNFNDAVLDMGALARKLAA